MERLRSIALMAVFVGLLSLLAGCPGLIANVVGASESLQQAINTADPGDSIRFMGTHQEDITIDKAGITLKGDAPGATIEGTLTVAANNVTTEDFDVDGDMIIDGDSGAARDMTIAGILDTPPGSMDDIIMTNFTVASWGGTSLGSFGVDAVHGQATVTLNGIFTCDTIVQPSESIQAAINNTSAGADRRPICVAGSNRQVAHDDPNGPPLTVDKSVNLQAMGPVTLEVTEAPAEGSFNIVEVDHDNVRIEGFTLTTDGLNRGIGVDVSSSATNVTLAGLTITETDTAIRKTSGESFELRNSTLQNNQAGIAVQAEGSIDIQITRNNIMNNGTGIQFSAPSVSAIDAENNWFGDASGPNDAQNSGESTDLNGDPSNCTSTPANEFNSSGTGDDIADDGGAPVDSCPWATSSF